MKLFKREKSDKIHALKIEDGKCLVDRLTYPKMTVLYNPDHKSGTVLKREPNVPEHQVQQAFFKALAFARQNVQDQK